MAKKKKSTHSYVAVLILISVFLVAAGVKVYDDLLADNISEDADKTAILYMHSRKTLSDNLNMPENKSLLRNADALLRIIHLFGYSDMIRPGRYEFEKGTNNLKLLRALVTGAQKPIDLTFKYAERTSDVVNFWCSRLEADSLELKALLDTANLTSLGLGRFQNVAVFIPNTYNFYWNTSAEELLSRMKKEYIAFWDSTRIQKAVQLGLQKGEVFTLASIVQKETAKRSEMPIIAGVYYNRLAKGMLLQADPTVLYAVNDKRIKRVGGAMLSMNSPYNTYKFKGLPPGPICIPDSRTVDAVLNLEHHDYIYFCAREDFSGYHNFASSFQQHQKNAFRFQRALTRKGVHL
ncbi:MAG: endolytic transglycosylase MltG [Bacteroidota bacterium]|jgi:UPF0755 protein